MHCARILFFAVNSVPYATYNYTEPRMRCMLLCTAAVDGFCQFPSFLHQSRDGDYDDSMTSTTSSSAAVWLTQSRYKRQTFRVDSQLEVTLMDGDTLVTKVKHLGLCSDTPGPAAAAAAGGREFNASCYQREFLYQRKCLSVEYDNKYVVEHNDGMYVSSLNLHIRCAYVMFCCYYKVLTFKIYTMIYTYHHKHVQ